jgi:tricorn protease
MVGELRASHLGITDPAKKNKVETGYLGWELEEIAGCENILQVKDILRDGPADKAWVRKGDYVFQIAGKEASAKLNMAQILNNQIGKEVKVYVSPTSNPKDGRYVSILPVGVEQIEAIKYRHWLMNKILTVRQGCQGKVIYLHLNEMNAQNLKKFREVVQQSLEHAEGMILDVRNNGGGLIHQELIDILIRKPFVAYQGRGQAKRYQPALYWDKPLVVLINENSFSDAEVFAYAIQSLKRGCLVGVPTAGGVIGTKDITLSNQTVFRVPRVGYYTLTGENMEGLGVKPDYLVAETPKDRIENRDPQLLKAIEIIMAEIEKKGKPVETSKSAVPAKEQNQNGSTESQSK